MKQEIHLSDLSAQVIEEGQRATLTVLEHPDLENGAVQLEVRPEEVSELGELAMDAVVVELQLPGEDQEPQRFTLTPGNFKKLTKRPVEEVLAGAEPAKVRRGLGRSAVNGGERNYATAEFAGEPHKGKTSPEEMAYVREHLEEVNARLAASGRRTIDPTHPDHAKRYGFSQP